LFGGGGALEKKQSSESKSEGKELYLPADPVQDDLND